MAAANKAASAASSEAAGAAANSRSFGLVCSLCGATASERSGGWRCSCGGPYNLNFSPNIPDNFADLLRTRDDTWLRYREALPVTADTAIRIGEACTPMVPVVVKNGAVPVKQEQISATGSFKDRGAFVLVSRARELGVEAVLEDSSGNAGTAIAAYCARAGISCDIYVPAATTSSKTRQIEAYGGRVMRIQGSREDTAEAAKAKAATAWYASHVYNPFFLHGVKTFAYEVWEQSGRAVPDLLVLPVGNGTLLLGAYLGFLELMKAGLAERMPGLVGVQAEACDPVVRAFHEETSREQDGVEAAAAARAAAPPAASSGGTVASGIAVAAPARLLQILEAVRESGGYVMSVSEEEIAGALTVAGEQGFYVEPTAAVGLAGAIKITGEGRHRPEDVVTAFTGHGLKKDH